LAKNRLSSGFTDWSRAQIRRRAEWAFGKTLPMPSRHARRIAIAICLSLVLLPALASAQSFPQTLGPNTVIGRLGVDPGPAQSIPFARLLSAIGGPCSTTTNGLVPATGGGTANFLRSDCTFATPTVSANNNQLLANISGSTGAAVGTNPSSLWDSFCSSSVGQFWVRLSAAWGCTALGYANPVWFGADPTGAADSTSAFNSTIATGLPIRWPGGSFKLNSAITANLANAAACFCMEGAGSNATVLNWPNASGGITINAASLLNNVNIKGVHLTTTQVGSGTAVNMLGVGSSGNPWSNFDDVLITGDDFTGAAGSHFWSIGLNLFNWGDINVFRTNTSGPVQVPGSAGGGVGLQYGGKAATSSFATILNVQSSSFNFAVLGVALHGFWQGVSLININCNGEVGTACVQEAGSAGGVLALLYISGSQMNTAGNQIDINTGIDTFTLSGNTITCFSNSCQGAALGGSLGVMATGNFFNTNGSPTSTFGLTTTGPSGVIVGNIFHGLSAGVDLESGSSIGRWALILILATCPRRSSITVPATALAPKLQEP
jgi:hypothetical protein